LVLTYEDFCNKAALHEKAKNSLHYSLSIADGDDIPASPLLSLPPPFYLFSTTFVHIKNENSLNQYEARLRANYASSSMLKWMFVGASAVTTFTTLGIATS